MWKVRDTNGKEKEEKFASSKQRKLVNIPSRNFFQTDDGEDDLKKGTQLLEIYALEIQMYTVQKNNKKLKALYEQSLQIKSAIPHPLIMGVIRGKYTQLLRVRHDCLNTSLLMLNQFLDNRMWR